MGTYTLGVDLSKYTEDQLWEHFPDEAAAEITRREGVTTTTPEVTTPGTISMTPGLNELIEEIGEKKIPDDVLDMIEPLRNPTEKYGIYGLRTKFGELDPEKQGEKLWDKSYKLIQEYGMDPSDPNIKKIMNYLTRMRMAAESGKQISYSQYLMNQHLMNQQKNLNPWLNAMPGVQVASTGSLAGMGIPNALQRQQQQAELMHAGNLALNQTPSQVAAQVAASQATQQGNYQAPTMTQQQMVQEAIKTGGTVNPHEATKAVYVPPPSQPVSGPHGGGGGGQGGGGGGQAAGQRPSRTSRPSGYAAVRRYGRADGGMVSLMDLLNRRI